MIKPEYKIPSMQEIANIPKNGYKLVSTFSGCGGSCLGFEMAGYTVLWANEFIPEAQNTYRRNHPKVVLSTRDIRQVSYNDIYRITGLLPGQLDVLEGSPPCADFSIAGKRRGGINTVEYKGQGRKKKYSDTKQQVDDLFYEFARILKELQPKVFVAENVKGLTLGQASILLGSAQADFFGRHEDTIYHTLVNCGYNVKYKVLNTKDYGVPQNRERLFFIGVRNNLNIEPVYPAPANYITTIREAWKNLVNTSVDIQTTEINPDSFRYKYLKMMKQGEDASKYDPYGRYFTHIRLHLDRVSPAILASQTTTFGLYHPTEDRGLTIPELKRIHSFPDDFILTGTTSKQCERIGRSVPPLMMYYIAKTIKEQILDRIN